MASPGYGGQPGKGGSFGEENSACVGVPALGTGCTLPGTWETGWALVGSPSVLPRKAGPQAGPTLAHLQGTQEGPPPCGQVSEGWGRVA